MSGLPDLSEPSASSNPMEALTRALKASGLEACPKCGGLFGNLVLHRCYEDTFDALRSRIGVGQAGIDSSWELSAILASHTGYEYTCLLNRNVSGAQGRGRAAFGMGFATPRSALEAAIEMARAVDADPAVKADEERYWTQAREPEI